MTEQLPQPEQKPSIAGRFFGDVFSMPGWQKSLLGLALGAGVVGAGGQVYSKLSPTSTANTQAVQKDSTGSSTAPPGRGFVGGSPQTPATPADQPAPQPEPTWFEQHSPGLTRTGFSFIAAFIIGWAFRVFIKAMAIITALGVGAMLLLSHFRVINIDFSAAEQHYATATQWLGDQALRLKDVAIAHLPASTSGAVGMFVGLRKK